MKPTWDNILRDQTDQYIGSMSRLADIASNLGYDYICWNDRIYKVDFVHPAMECTDTGLIFDDIGIPNNKETVVLAGHTMGGEPTMLRYQVECTETEHEQGVHYVMAQEMAEEEGYESPFVCFDSTEISEVISMGKELDNL